MELILMQAGKENQEQQAAEDFERSDSIFRYFGKHMNNWGRKNPG